MEQAIRTRIIDFLKANITQLPLEAAQPRRAFLIEAIPDHYRSVYGERPIDLSSNIFIPLLIETLESYEIHGKGQGLIVGILQRARNDVGLEAQQLCDLLIADWQVFCETRPTQQGGEESSPGYEYDVFLSYDEEYEDWIKDFFLIEFSRIHEHFKYSLKKFQQVLFSWAAIRRKMSMPQKRNNRCMKFT